MWPERLSNPGPLALESLHPFLCFIQTTHVSSIYMLRSFVFAIMYMEDLTRVVISYEIYETSLWRDS